MRNWKNYLLLAGLLLLGACSEDSQQGYDEASAQQTLDNMKGVYDCLRRCRSSSARTLR